MRIETVWFGKLVSNEMPSLDQKLLLLFLIAVEEDKITNRLIQSNCVMDCVNS